MSRPMLLVATEFSPGASGGGPAIVRQMLRGWPADRLAWWSCLSAGPALEGPAPSAIFEATIPPRLYPHQRATQLKSLLLRRLWVPQAAAHLRQAIEKSRADALWIIPHQWSILPLLRVIQEIETPFHVSIHDYPDALSTTKTLGKKVPATFMAAIEHLYRKANSRDAISPEMAADLEARAGKPVEQILHAGVEAVDLENIHGRTTGVRSVLKIAYAGTIVAPATFAAIAASIGRIRKLLPRPIELHFFGAHSYQTRDWFDRAWMHEHGELGASALLARLRDCHWGLAPMELTDDNPRYNRFSLPTKIVSYLAAGLPIIAVGHSSSTISHLASRYHLGVAIDEDSINQVDDILATALTDSDPQSRYGAALRQCIVAEFDAEQMRRKLHERFAAVSPR